VEVVAVYPGGMDTEFWRSARGTDVDPEGFIDPDYVADVIVRTLPSLRTGHVSDITISR
jgi:uncharacterized protein